MQKCNYQCHKFKVLIHRCVYLGTCTIIACAILFFFCFFCQGELLFFFFNDLNEPKSFVLQFCKIVICHFIFIFLSFSSFVLCFGAFCFSIELHILQFYSAYCVELLKDWVGKKNLINSENELLIQWSPSKLASHLDYKIKKLISTRTFSQPPQTQLFSPRKCGALRLWMGAFPLKSRLFLRHARANQRRRRRRWDERQLPSCRDWNVTV